MRSSWSTQAAKFISLLEPKPGRDYGGQEPTYVVPDVFIQKIGDDYVVTLNESAVPRLRLAGYYQRVMNDGRDAAPRPRSICRSGCAPRNGW